MRASPIVVSMLLIACGGDPPAPDPPEPPVCGSANRPIPAGLTELAYDDGVGVSSIAEQSWIVSGETMRDAHLREGVGFELDRPARVWGFAVQWVNLPDGFPALEIPASIFADFGYNGFDFWLEPTWTGTRCFADIRAYEWTHYGLEEPLVFDQPGLVWVGHDRQFDLMPVFAFDGSPVDDCSVFGECHSAWNLPEVDTNLYFNGVSLSSPHDFLVRLYVEYDAEPSAGFFADVGAVGVGSRHAWGDYDDDGDDDLLTGNVLLANDAGLFTDVTESAGLGGVSMHGGVWGDFDNDRCLDLFAFSQSTRTNDTLFRSNCDGTFADVTDAAGIDDSQSYYFCEGDTEQSHQPSHAAAWWDIDADGFLDLYVANYSCGGAYYSDQVLHNEGDGTFSDWSGQHGFSDRRLASRGAAPIDFDRDGDVDLLVNTYRLQANMMFVNQGGTVVDRSADLGLAGHPDFHNGATYYGHTIGVAWGDLDNDGDFDLIEANLAHPRFFGFSDKTRVLLQQTGTFTDISGDWGVPASAAGLRYQETHSVPVLADFDNDGHLDLVISAVYDGRPTDFYWGVGDGAFTLDAYGAGIDVEDGWGMAASDFDHDGDVDLAVKGAILANTRDDPGHWLQVRPVGNVNSNRGAYGATVAVTTSDGTQLRHVQGGSGQGGQESAFLHVGLGDAVQVDAVRVVFPGGATVDVGTTEADQRLWVFEDGTVETGWTPPWRR